MSSLGEILTPLRQAVQHLHEALVHVGAGIEQGREIRERCEALGATGVVERISGVVDAAERVEAMLLAGIDTGDQLVAATEAIRHGDQVAGTAGGSVTAASAAPGGFATPTPVTPGWLRPFEVPEYVREAGGRLRARPPDEEERFTTGIVDGEAIHSGGGDRSLAADLDHAPLSRPPVTFYDHVESKVAARMRREHRKRPDRRQRVEIIIDNTVCGAIAEEHNYVWGCDRILPGILPDGSTLVVWSTCDGGRTFWRRAYHGTGERIRP